MATITGYTSERMKNIEDTTVVGGSVNPSGSLILTTRQGASLDAGIVRPDWLAGTQAQYYRGDKTWQTLDKNAVGLSNVDNISVATLIANYIPKWKTGAVYAIGDRVINPIGEVVTANAAHTAAATYTTDVVKWDDQSPRAKGLVANTSATTTSGAIGAATVVLNIPTFTFKAGRRYRVVVSGGHYSSGTSSTAAFSIYTCSTADSASVTTGLTLIKQSAQRVNVANEGRGIFISKENFMFGADTTLQLKYVIERITGSDGIYSQASPDNILTFAIYDDGANF